ncbi:MAG: tetratricopeptide repeat protein, partial [Pyrinomonadaceae bacterium]
MNRSTISSVRQAATAAKSQNKIRSARRRGGSSKLSKDELDRIFLSVGQQLREGHSSDAEKILARALDSPSLDYDDLANLKRLLAFTLETVGRYHESLEAVNMFENEEMLARLAPETHVRVATQLAIAYNNLGDHPKAVTLLKETLAKAREQELRHLLGNIEIGLARVYRKLNECPISRDHAQNALNATRETGDWLGMAEAYRELALSHHQEGSSEKSLEYFGLGIQIIGERSAPFMLGRLYSDMSGAYWFLRQASKGVECLEKSIEFFGRTEHVLNSVIAYNNLGINLMAIGEWDRAEEVIHRALELATHSNHAHIAGILDSLGEIKILRGRLNEARELLERAVSVARQHKREWYEAQAMRNLARCQLAQGEFKEAAATARQTINLSGQIGDKHYANMAGLV